MPLTYSHLAHTEADSATSLSVSVTGAGAVRSLLAIVGGWIPGSTPAVLGLSGVAATWTRIGYVDDTQNIHQGSVWLGTGALADGTLTVSLDRTASALFGAVYGLSDPAPLYDIASAENGATDTSAPSVTLTATRDADAAIIAGFSRVSDFTPGAGLTSLISGFSSTATVPLDYAWTAAPTSPPTTGTATYSGTLSSNREWAMFAVGLTGSGAASTNVALTGTVAPLTTAAPAGTVATAGNVALAGPVAALAMAAPVGSATLETNIADSGPVAGLTLTAPAGTVTVSGNVTLTGTAAALAAAAPAGTVATTSDIVVTGAAAALTVAAPAGAVTTTTVGDVSLVGAPAALGIAAPAGTVSATSAALGVTLTGAPAPLALTAAAGTATVASNRSDVTLLGEVSTLDLAAFAGDIAASTLVYLLGESADLTIAAPDGAVSLDAVRVDITVMVGSPRTLSPTVGPTKIGRAATAGPPVVATITIGPPTQPWTIGPTIGT